ncbi:uncharacterized protein OCT59_004566 [Rhizophagus irregularis]|uniref:Protein kinase domain-containing protein n=2 Tax=Rhizophagus irregularis TaxID=588596 RepID=U9TST2_RHIID|nr:hypothetical protein GLOIN_2v1766513 [Rhizophagus irregularis DAOM 181602=DAOM 197198]EXX74729.1 hypothetical protein RirG_048440 [Rhizophagus irregularis DAOM 197198w]POG78619.1 hypothetical protein GLOIN_2v1766513 [Rhizophagus irregularis DAOM 181602=DAOM 197198]UZO13060.1 hypothetical protein OCT59_004566 [Rhizophagus irregularis]|eukprot:XP_025185485.1 hypothetical protein GLOIN_2v1766513 [Rhizophagus irregularis DAOM 181602=DAOM 197198]
MPNKKVSLKYLNNSQNITSEFLNELKGGFAIVYSAIWMNGPLKYNEKKYNRKPDKEVALKVLYNSQNITDEFINEV